MNERHLHDCAWSGATAILEIFDPLLRPEQQNEAFGLVYQTLRALLEASETFRERETTRLSPSPN